LGDSTPAYRARCQLAPARCGIGAQEIAEIDDQPELRRPHRLSEGADRRRDQRLRKILDAPLPARQAVAAGRGGRAQSRQIFPRPLGDMKNVRTWRRARDELLKKARIRVPHDGRLYIGRFKLIAKIGEV
jgi:hypothetical protein